MGKWPLIAGIIVAGVLLYQFNGEKITVNDVFNVTYEEASDEKALEATSLSSDQSLSTILPTNSKAVNEKFFQDLAAERDIQTFIVIGNNAQLKGHYKIAVSKKSIKTDSGILNIDTDFIDNLLQNGNKNIGESFSPFYFDNSIKKLAPIIKENFPESKIVPILIKDFVTDEEMEELAKLLADLKGNDDFVVTILSVSTDSFDANLTKNLLQTFDKNATAALDTENNQIINLILNYVEIFGAKKAEILGSGIINFHLGEPVEADRNLSILALGDMMMGRYVRVYMDSQGKDYIFANIKDSKGQFFKGADVVFANLEGPIKGKGTSGGTSMVFSFNEDIAPFLKKYGFNLFSISNNHAVDQGWDGRDTTITALTSADLGWCGHPSEAEANSVYYSKVLDKDFAFICFQDVTFKLNDEAAVQLIKDVRPNVDFLIVSVHWGYEYKNKPDWSTQIEPGRAFIDAGADFVIGHHPHVIQSFEIYKDRFIFYSLGNFVFDQYWSAGTQEELGLGIVLDDADGGSGDGADVADDGANGSDGGDNGGDDANKSFKTKVYLIPMKSESSQPRLMTEEERAEWVERFIGYGEYSDSIKEMIRNGVIEW